MSNPEASQRRRWISLGELIAAAALIVSALGLWLTWQHSGNDKPTRIVEQRQPIPLTLRGEAEDDGRVLAINPVEPGHALQSLTLTVRGASPIHIGSDGRLPARDLQATLRDQDRDRENGVLTVPVRIDASYVESGTDRRRGANYVLRYRWEGGGLLGGRSLRLVGLSR